MITAMFTAEGNQKVEKIVTAAQELMDVSEYGVEPVWNWVLNELERLAEQPGFEEAMDTAVREVCYDRVVCW